MMPLTVSHSVTFDADGFASVSVGPSRAGQSWLITRISTNIVDSNTRESMRVYINGNSPLNYLDGTRRANADTSETNIEVGNLDRLTFVWDGGTPGKAASLNLIGKLFTNGI